MSKKRRFNKETDDDRNEESMETKETTSAENKYRSRRNPWVLTSVIFFVLSLGLLFYPITDGVPTGNIIASNSGPVVEGGLSTSEIGQLSLDFFNSVLSETPGTLGNIEETKGVYMVNINVQGQTVPIYVTKDGYWIAQGREFIDMSDISDDTQETQPQDTGVTKSDKPVVELFVMSHCPYGTQAEKGIIPVYELLGDKIDSSIKFVYYSMHPSAGEVQEQLRQYCIQEEQNDKYLDYLTCFLKAGDSESCLAEANIDTAKLDTCYASTDKEFNVIANLEDQSSWLNGRFPMFNIYLAENQ